MSMEELEAMLTNAVAWREVWAAAHVSLAEFDRARREYATERAAQIAQVLECRAELERRNGGSHG